MNTTMQSILKSYARGVVVAVIPLIAIHETDLWAYAVAVVAGVVAPALRALDKKDPTFGLVADTLEAEVIKAAKKSASKKKTK
jgi:hypothetical protein